jgi:succinate dehydrogenase / fumarate reductase iron-sulfur subunit
MRATFAIQKFNPEIDARPHLEEYRLDVAWRGNTVLDGLFQIKHQLDGSLTFRASCRSAICGSCPMVINGRERLACQTLIADEIDRSGRIEVKPLRQLRVVKDLVVEMDPFWNKVNAITPWLTPKREAAFVRHARGEIGEVVIPQNVHQTFYNVDACILCGACVSACNSLDVSPGFLGPAALAKAYRFVADPREGERRERLERLTREDGIWDCVRCNFCVEVCPKDVQPMEAIIRLRREAIREGLTEHPGATHITAFMDIVRREGRLNEARMPLAMVWPNLFRMLKILPLGLKMFVKGKVPSFFQRPIKGIREIRRLFKLRETFK